jgi:predicted chitinase
MRFNRNLRVAFLRLCIVAAAGALLPCELRAAAGDLYVAGAGNTVVSRITSDGSATSFGGSFTFPFTVRFDRGGNAYVLEDGVYPFQGRVFKITPTGDLSVVVGPPATGSWDPQALAIDGAGNLYVANNGPNPAEIRKYTLAGAFIGVLTTLPGDIWEMACDTAGNVLATAGISLYRTTPAGVTSTFISFNGQARGVTVDPAGNIFATAEGETIMRKFPPGGGFSNFGTNLSEAFFLASDANGNIYASAATGTSSSGESFIYKFSPTGARRTIATAARVGGANRFWGMAVEPPTGKSLNISSRVQVQTGDNAAIAGIIITGSAGKQVIMRAIGPSLANAGVQGPLQDPVLQLYNSGNVLVQSNDNWKSQNQTGIEATGLAPTDDRESALVLGLGSEPYTVVVRGKNNTTGVGVVEIYDLDQAGDSRLANISTRGLIGTGENVLVGGFILGGNGARGIVRAIGPSLTAAGVPGALSNPILSIRNGNGVEIASNDDWKSSQRAEIEATGVAPQHDLESAYVGYFAPGNNTVIVSGSQGATGVGLVEFYNLQ